MKGNEAGGVAVIGGHNAARSLQLAADYGFGIRHFASLGVNHRYAHEHQVVAIGADGLFVRRELQPHARPRGLYGRFGPRLAVAPGTYAQLARLIADAVPPQAVRKRRLFAAPQRAPVQKELGLVARGVHPHGGALALAPLLVPVGQDVGHGLFG